MKTHHAKKAGKAGRAKTHAHAHGVASARHHRSSGSRHSGGARRISAKKR